MSDTVIDRIKKMVEIERHIELFEDEDKSEKTVIREEKQDL